MTKKLVHLPLLVVPLVDQLAKARSEWVLNQDFMLGLFATLPLFYKSVLAVAFFLLLFAAYVLFLLLLIPEVPLLRLSCSVYLAAMLSNCLDKMVFLGVRDHITFERFFPGMIFNVADILQWVSLPFLIFSIFYYSHQLWRDDCLRRSFFITSRSHAAIGLRFGAIVLLNIVLCFCFFMAFLKYLGVQQIVFGQFILSFALFSLSGLVCSSVFILLYSQRIVGPLISLGRFLRDPAAGRGRFRVRNGDPLKELEEIAELIRTKGSPSAD